MEVTADFTVALSFNSFHHKYIVKTDQYRILLISVTTNLGPPEESDGLLGLLECLDLVSNDEGNLIDTSDNMSLGHDQGGHSGGGNSGAHGVPLLGNIDLPVPSPPGLGGCEHAEI